MTDTVRIAHLISPIQLYGKEKWLLALLNHIDTRAFPSIVIPIRHGGASPFSDRMQRMGVPVLPIIAKGRFDWGAVSAATGIVRDHQIDIVHSHDYKSDIFAYLVGRMTGAKTVSTPHGWSNARDPKLRLYQSIDRFVLRRFDHVVPLSPQLFDRLSRVDRERITLIRNFIDLSGQPEATSFDRGLVSYVGRLVWLKRVEDAVKAMQHVEDREIRLQVIGDGPLRPRLENLANQLGVSARVSFAGFREDALDLINSSAALVLPSLTEGLTRVGMEAMALGKPVIGTDIAGIMEIVKHRRTGLIVPTRDPRAIASAITDLLSDRDLYDSISSQGRAFIEDRHSAEKGAKEYEALYRHICSMD